MIQTVSTKFKLIHYFQHCAVTSSGKQLPKWGFEQQEVSCNPNLRDKNALWNVEDNYFELCEYGFLNLHKKKKKNSEIFLLIRMRLLDNLIKLYLLNIANSITLEILENLLETSQASFSLKLFLLCMKTLSIILKKKHKKNST